MHLSEQAQATLLLTAWFGKQEGAGVKPLTPTEWGRFALFLRNANLTPADLLRSAALDALLGSYTDRTITLERIRKLLERSAALGIALEKWQRAGLWIMTRSDADYPKRWKFRLRNDAPPVLFGAGNRDLLNRGGIAVVGSRDLDASQVDFTGQLGRDIAHQGQTVISGGARGADEAAMRGALESDGMAVGILADSLLRTSTSSKYRKSLMSKDLALVSPFNPEAGFNVGNAMARNKYIYCLSDAAIVIATTENKGGTWSGAIENLKHAWVPLWVRSGNVPGNRALVERGAVWLPDSFDARQLVVSDVEVDAQAVLPGAMEDVAAYAERPAVEDCHQPVMVEKPSTGPDTGSKENGREVNTGSAIADGTTQVGDPYTHFLSRLRLLLSDHGLSLKELQAEIGIGRNQLSQWLKRAEEEGVIAKTRTPVKYRLLAEGDKGHQSSGGKDGGKSGGSGKNSNSQASFGF